MTSIRELRDELSERYDLDPAATLEAVTAYAGQVGDGVDFETGTLTDEAAAVIRLQVDSDHRAQPADVLTELDAAQQDVTAQDQRIERRDAAVRQALAECIPVQAIADRTGLSRARIYQIRDGRR